MKQASARALEFLEHFADKPWSPKIFIHPNEEHAILEGL